MKKFAVIAVTLLTLTSCDSPEEPDVCSGTGTLTVQVRQPAYGNYKMAPGVKLDLVSALADCNVTRSVVTDESGTATFSALAATQWLLSVTPPDSLIIALGEAVPVSIGVPAGATVTHTVKLHFAPRDTVFTLYVGPQQVDCRSWFPQTCYLVKTRPEDQYHYFYDNIQGFNFEPGYAYVLRVIRRRRPDLPADAPLYSWHLVEVVAKQPAS